MKKEIKKLNGLLKLEGRSKKQRKNRLQYLAVVLLGYKIDDVSQYFGLSYNQVRAVVTTFGVRLRHDCGFRGEMHRVAWNFKSGGSIGFRFKSCSFH